MTLYGRRIWYIAETAFVAIIKDNIGTDDMVAAGFSNSISTITGWFNNFPNNKKMYVTASLATLNSNIGSLPGLVDYVDYDYENGGPDWDGTSASVLSAATTVHNAGLKFSADTPLIVNGNQYQSAIIAVSDAASIQGFGQTPSQFSSYYTTNAAAIRALKPGIDFIMPAVGGSETATAAAANYNQIYPQPLLNNGDRILVYFTSGNSAKLSSFCYCKAPSVPSKTPAPTKGGRLSSIFRSGSKSQTVAK